MKKFLVIALFPFLLYACASTDTTDDDRRAEKTETEDFSSSGMERVEVKTENGSIETSIWDEDSIHVVFEMWATGLDKQDAEGNLDDIDISISDTDPDVLYIDVDFPNREGIEYGCNVSVELPSSRSLDLESTNGSITVLESKGGIECFTSNGTIRIEDTEGDAELKTSNGKIVAENHSGDLEGRTSNGEIDADIILPENGRCILETSNGSIDLSIPRDTSAEIQASTTNGTVEISGLEVTIITMRETEFKGKMGDGSGSIDLETTNGSIVIKAKP